MSRVKISLPWTICLVTALALTFSGCSSETETAQAPAPQPTPPANNAPAPGDSGAAGGGAPGESGGYGGGGEEGYGGGGEEGYGGYGEGEGGPGEEGYGEEGYGEGMEGYGEEGYGEEGYGEAMEGYGEEGYGEAMEGYGEEGYGDAMGGYGAGGYGGRGNARQAEPPKKEEIPEDYFGQAAWSFQRGLEARAHKLLLAHLVAESEQAGDVFNATAFSKLKREPTWAVRWGAGLRLSIKGGYEGDPMPITANMKSPLGRGAARQGRGDYGGGPGGEGYEEGGMEYSEGYGMPGREGRGRNEPTTPSGMAQLQKYTGMVVDLTLEEFSMRFNNNAFGAIFPNLPEDALAVAAREAAKSNPRGGGYGGPGMGGYGEGMEGYGEEMAEMEEYGEPGMEGYEEEMAEYGAPGMEGYGEGMEEAYGYGGPGGPSGRNQKPQTVGNIIPAPVPPAQNPRLVPGMVYVGEGETDQLLEKAREAGIDVLMEFHVRVDHNTRTERVENSIRVKVIDVATGEAIATSRQIENIEVYMAMQRETPPEEAIREALNSLYGAVDRDVKVIPMPTLTAEQAKSRVGSLLASVSADPLKTFAEVRLYQHQGLLSDAEVELIADMLLGENGLLMLAGTEEQKREILQQWVERIPTS